MASGLENIETIESPFRRFVTTIGVFPTAFTDAMTYYECLAYLVKYLDESVVPAVNENAEALKELQDYVVHYFDNLDVQDEINNKLDQMVEDGTLQEIITAYIQANTAWCFDTVADLKTAENLIDGSYAQTLGYNTKNDGGASVYSIRNILNTDVVDEKKIIALSDDNLVAEIITPNEITPQIFGGYGDGVTDDTNVISYILTNYSCLTLPAGKSYKISTINVPVKDITINGDGKFIITGNGIIFNAPLNRKVINDISIEITDGSAGLVFTGESSTAPYNTLTISNVTVKTTNLSGKIGLDIESENEAFISNTSLYGCSIKFVGSINPSVVNCTVRHSAMGIYYANETAGREPYSCGLKVLNTTILGCTIGIKSVQCDSLQVQSCMIDYDDYPIIILGTSAPVIDNCYLSSRSGNEVIHIAPNNSESGVFGGNGLSTEGTADSKISNCYVIQHDEALTNSAVYISGNEGHIVDNVTVAYCGKAGFELHDLANTTIKSCNIRSGITGGKAILSYRSGSLGDTASLYYTDIKTDLPIYVHYARTDIQANSYVTKQTGTTVLTAGTTSTVITTTIPQGINYAMLYCSNNSVVPTYSIANNVINVTIPAGTTNNFRLNWEAYGSPTYNSF